MKIFFTAFLVCFVTCVNAQQNASPLSSIRVTGDAVVTAKPERAQIDVGVLTQEKQSQPAAAQNAKQLDAVMLALHKLLGNDADIKTINYSLSPEYQYRPIGAKASVSSYTAINVVRVTVDDLDKVGPVIDAATQAGANHIESVQYTVRDPQALRAQALREAASKAKASADALASALNLKVIRVLSVEESRDADLPPNDPMAAGAPRGPDGPPGPGGPETAQPGSFSVSANVTLTVEVGAR
jgi:uncharacterized protein YggE